MSLRAMLAVFDNSEATLANRLVLLALADHAHDDGSNAWPSVPLLAAKAKVHDRTVTRALQELEQAGEITQTGTTKHGVKVWQITIDGLSTGGPTGDISSARGDISSRRGDKSPPEPKNRNEHSSGDKLSPLEQARRYSDRSPSRHVADARLHFEGNLGLEGDQLVEAIIYHEQRSAAA